MTANLFRDWFHHQFVPHVRSKLTSLGEEPTTLLILDNCSAHPDDELIFDDGAILIKFFLSCLKLSPAKRRELDLVSRLVIPPSHLTATMGGVSYNLWAGVRIICGCGFKNSPNPGYAPEKGFHEDEGPFVTLQGPCFILRTTTSILLWKLYRQSRPQSTQGTLSR